MRKLFAVLALMLVLVGCGDSTGPDANAHVGVYTLQTVNGNSLPWAIFVAGNDKVEITQGRLNINADNTFSFETTIRVTERGSVSSETDSTTGTYSLDNNAVTFTDADGDLYTAALSGSTMTFTLEGFVFVFRK